jgi:small subunit ribosomal protein S17
MAQGTTPERTATRKQKVGRVVSNKMDKTVVVAVDYLRPHPIYRKTVRKTNKFYAHDEDNRAAVGDTVRIEETRPLSKTKRWRVVEIMNAGLVGDQATVDQEVAAALNDDEEVQS